MTDQFDPALSPLGRVIERGVAAAGGNGVSPHHADDVAGTQRRVQVVRFVDPLHCMKMVKSGCLRAATCSTRSFRSGVIRLWY